MSTKVGKPRGAASVIYNGIGDARLQTSPTRTAAPHFLYIGMLRDLKGPDVFIDAFARRPSAWSGVRFRR